jgi:hypothetical protein
MVSSKKMVQQACQVSSYLRGLHHRHYLFVHSIYYSCPIYRNMLAPNILSSLFKYILPEQNCQVFDHFLFV